MRIGVVVAVHQRPWVTKLFYTAIQRVQDQWRPHTTTVYVAGDDEPLASGLASSHRHMAHQHGAVFCETLNRPLGAKFNAGFINAWQDGCDRVVLMGSDDLLTPTMADRYKGVLQHPTLRYAGLRSSVVIRPFTCQAAMLYNHRAPFRRYEPMGPGRIVSREVLDRLHGMPFHPLKHRGGLDYNMTQRLVHEADTATPDVTIMSDEDASLVDVKTGTGISGFDQVLEQAHAVPLPYRSVLRQLPAAERALVGVLSTGIT